MNLSLEYRGQTGVPVEVEGLTPDKVRDMSLDFTATNYLLHFALPNFFFHSSMAYAILRNQGFAIGKRDYLGALRTKG